MSLNFSIFKHVLRFVDSDNLYYQLYQVNKFSKKYCEKNFKKPTLKQWLKENFSNLLTIQECIPSLTISKIYSDNFRLEKMRYIESYGFFKIILDGGGTYDVIKHCLRCVKQHRGIRRFYDCLSWGRQFVGSRFWKNYDYDEKKLWFEALMVSIEYDRFDLSEKIFKKHCEKVSEKQLTQLYRRCHKFGQFNMIGLIPKDKLFKIDWLMTLSNAKNESIYQQLIKLCPNDIGEISNQAKKYHLKFAQQNQLFVLMSIILNRMKQRKWNQ